MSVEDNGKTASQAPVSTGTASRPSSSSTDPDVSTKVVIVRNVSSHSSHSSLTESSSEIPSPPGILRSASSCTVLSPSSSSSSVTFAPLPDIGPRKRNAALQLGVGARSRMLRNRRIIMQQMQAAAEEGEELQPHHLPPDVAATVQWHQGPPGDPGLAEDAVDDAFIALGRMMKRAGKGVWRRMSLKDKHKHKGKNVGKENEGEGEDEDGEGGEDDDAEEEGSKKKGNKKGKSDDYSDGTVTSDVEDTPTKGKLDETKFPARSRSMPNLGATPRRSTEDQEGRVWEEEVSEEFKKRLSGAVSAAGPNEASDVKSAVISVQTTRKGSVKGKSRNPR